MGPSTWGFLRKGISLFPKKIRHGFYRKLLRLNWEIPNNLHIKLAENEKELNEAFSLLHDTYVQEGFTQPDPSKKRTTPYHKATSTKVVVAQWDGRVVGTVSIIQPNPLGLPLESAFDLSILKEKYPRICEISSLAIDPNFRGGKRNILFSLLKFIWIYNQRYLGNDIWVISVHPKFSDFYEGILGFQRLSKKVVSNYKFANGAPAAALYLNAHTSTQAYSKIYGKAPLTKNLYWWFVSGPYNAGLILKECHFPSHPRNPMGSQLNSTPNSKGVSKPLEKSPSPMILDQWLGQFFPKGAFSGKIANCPADKTPVHSGRIEIAPQP